MVVVLSRFRVANAMQADVERAFRERPREVEQAPGFLWLEVFADHADPAIFYLLTRWTDLDSFERWHGSDSHRQAHALIPKGLKLDASWTQVFTLDRLDGATGPPLTEMVADATLALGEYTTTSSGIYMFALATDGTVRTCNPAACEQLEGGGSLDGRSILEYMPEPDGERLRALLERPGRASQVRLNFGPPRRMPFTLDCWIHVHPAGATLIGQPTFRREQQFQEELMAINQDLAVLSRERSREARDQRSGREEAEQLNRQRNAFLTVLAHELRQPIGGALAALGVLRKMHPDAGLERPRALLERQLHQITRLVEDLADTARVAAGEIELRRTDVDLVARLRELATGWEAIAQAQHKAFVAELPPAPVLVWGDPERLQQVFSNLVNNALKYTPPGGTVTLRAVAERGWLSVSVRDEGEGIPAERLPRIFDLFQRATQTGTGLGVGLAVVKALVEAHGGAVAAASAGIGRGALFTVRLPVPDQPAESGRRAG